MELRLVGVWEGYYDGSLGQKTEKREFEGREFIFLEFLLGDWYLYIFVLQNFENYILYIVLQMGIL